MNDQQNFKDSYDAFGNLIPTPMTDNPKSNPGIVYLPANQPTNPGALKVARQTSENIVWKTKDGGTIDIGTQNTSPSTTEGEAGIVIYLKGKNPNQLEKVVSITEGHPTIGAFTSRPLTTTEQRDTPIAFFTIYDDSLQRDQALLITAANKSDGLYALVTGSNNAIVATNDLGADDNVVDISNTVSANTNSPVKISNATTISSHFKKIINMQAGASGVTLYTSDGTTPNGNLVGAQGDICLKGPSGQPFYCSVAGSNVWVGM